MAIRILRFGDRHRSQSGVRRARILGYGVAVLIALTSVSGADAATQAPVSTTPTTPASTTPITPASTTPTTPRSTTHTTPPSTTPTTTTATTPESIAPATAASAPIPMGTALWYACTEPVFSGPLLLRCPVPYNPGYLETFLRGFSRFTPENEFKMMFLEPVENRFYFTLADQIARFAVEYHKTIRGHTLIWGGENPLWLSHPLLPWNRAALTNVMRTYISTVVGHFASMFPGVVTEWDVINEPLTVTGALNSNPWERVLGPSYIRLALDYAHAADPSARLVINSNGADTPGATENDLLELATALKQSGAPLGAVGFEAHVTADNAATLAQLLSLWRRYAAAGLDVEVTELDVGNDPNDPAADTPAAKSAIFDRYAEACRLAGNCVGLSVWGVADQYSWLGPNSNALLYNSAFQPSPAVAFIERMLSGQPLSPTPSADATGPATSLGRAVRVVGSAVNLGNLRP